MTLTKINDDWIPLQIKVFTKWISSQLNDTNHAPIQDISKDLVNGVLLVDLATKLTHKKAPRNWEHSPKRDVDMVQNCELALQMFKDDGVNLVGISGKDITDNKQKLILGLIWTLILHYSVAKNTQLPKSSKVNNGSDKSLPKESAQTPNDILIWANSRISHYPNVYNFEPYDLSICALLDSYFPDQINYYYLDQTDMQKNYELAVNTMKNLGIPVYVDADDLELNHDKVDGKTLLTQLAAAKGILDQKEQNEIKQNEKKYEELHSSTSESDYYCEEKADFSSDEVATDQHNDSQITDYEKLSQAMTEIQTLVQELNEQKEQASSLKETIGRLEHQNHFLADQIQQIKRCDAAKLDSYSDALKSALKEASKEAESRKEAERKLAQLANNSEEMITPEQYLQTMVEIQNLTSAITSLKGQLNDQTDKNEKLEQQKQLLKLQIKDIEKREKLKIDAYADALHEALKNENDEFEECQRLEAELEELRESRNGESNHEFFISQRQYMQTMEEIRNLTVAITAMKQELDATQKENMQAYAEIDRLNMAIDIAETEVETQAQQIVELQAYAFDLIEAFDQSENVIEEQDKEIIDLQNHMPETLDNFENTERIVNKLSKKLDITKHEIKKLSSELSAVPNHSSVNEANLKETAELTASLAIARAESESNAEALNIAMDEYARESIAKREQERKVKHLREKLRHAKQTIINQREENEKLEKDREQLQSLALRQLVDSKPINFNEVLDQSSQTEMNTKSIQVKQLEKQLAGSRILTKRLKDEKVDAEATSFELYEAFEECLQENEEEKQMLTECKTEIDRLRLALALTQEESETTSKALIEALKDIQEISRERDEAIKEIDRLAYSLDLTETELMEELEKNQNFQCTENFLRLELQNNQDMIEKQRILNRVLIGENNEMTFELQDLENQMEQLTISNELLVNQNKPIKNRSNKQDVWCYDTDTEPKQLSNSDDTYESLLSVDDNDFEADDEGEVINLYEIGGDNSQYQGRKFALTMKIKEQDGNIITKAVTVLPDEATPPYLNQNGVKLDLSTPHFSTNSNEQFVFGLSEWNTIMGSAQYQGMVFDICKDDTFNPPDGTPLYLCPFHGKHNQQFIYQNNMIFAKQNGQVVTYVGGETPFVMMKPDPGMDDKQTFYIHLL